MIRQAKTLWIIDFDYALFDLYRLMDEFGALLKREFGIPESLYRRSKVDVQNKTLYSFERHIRAIQKESKLPYKDAMRYIEVLLKRSQRYFFSDTMPFMRRIAKQGEVVLLSHGHTLQQRRKIKASGIEKYCDRVIITSTKAKKAEWVKKLAKHRERVVIVNDDPEETLQMAVALADVQARAGEHVGVARVILVERPGGKYFPIPRHKSYDIVRDLRKITSLL
jgi:FMN phosphatase YigB (HAD superfamily)